MNSVSSILLQKRYIIDKIKRILQNKKSKKIQECEIKISNQHIDRYSIAYNYKSNNR